MVMISMAGRLAQVKCQSKIMQDEYQLLEKVESMCPNLILLQINCKTKQPMSQIVESLLSIIKKKTQELKSNTSLAKDPWGNIILYRADGGTSEGLNLIDRWLESGCKKYIGTYKSDMFIERVRMIIS